MALRAERLNHSEDSSAPVVLNAALSGSGPMLQQITLRRFLKAGIRPSLVFLEIMPLALSIRQGAPLEERHKWTKRYRATELVRLNKYYAEPYRLYYPWIESRLVPSYFYQGEFHEEVSRILTPNSGPLASDRDAFGWYSGPADLPDAKVDLLIAESLRDYRSALTEPRLAPGPIKALRDTVSLCQTQRMAVVLVIPPESSHFRSFAPAVAKVQHEAVTTLAAEWGVPLVDASAWIDDRGFWDGHHATPAGADQYTARFAKEALLPHVSGMGPKRLARNTSPESNRD
jgi:hypothetical protein